MNEYLDNISTEYQQFHITDSQTQAMMDSLRNSVDHIHYGHDLDSLLEAYEIEGVPGVTEWFGHMAQDFASPGGIPLPFADVIHQLTGMSAEQAVDWLTANLTDAVEMGAEATIMSFFRQNPKAYSICLGLGIVFGLYSNNSMLVAMNGLLYFCKLRKEGRLESGLWNNADRFIRTSFAMVDRVCTYTFIANTALELVGNNLPHLTGQFVDMMGLGGKVVKAAKLSAAAAGAADMMAGVANFGMSLLVSKAVGKLVEKANEAIKEELAKVEPIVEIKRQFIELLRKQAPPETLAPLIEMMEENGVYKSMI